MTTMSSARMKVAITNPRLVLLATSLAVLLAQIDTSVVNLALRSIAAGLRAGVTEMQWVIDAYNLVYASLLLTGGTLGDIYGRRRVFLLGIVLFTGGTIVCALAPDAATLIAGRAISGLGAAFALPMSLVLLTLAYPRREERAQARHVQRCRAGGLEELAREPIEGGTHQRLLAAEVPVHEPVVHAGARRDVAHRDGGRATLGQERDRGVDERRDGVLLPAGRAGVDDGEGHTPRVVN